MSKSSYLVATFHDRGQLVPMTRSISLSDAVSSWSAVEGHAHLVIKLKGNGNPEEIASLSKVAHLERYEILSEGEPPARPLDPAESCAYVFAEVEPSRREAVARELCQMPEVLFCSQVSGGCDLVAAVRGENFHAIDLTVEEQIRTLMGIVRVKVERIIELSHA